MIEVMTIKQPYKALELSTKLIIDEALRRNIDVEVLDEADNIIRLRKGDKIEYVKKATMTSLDNYIVPLLMENKEVTKTILREHGLPVPDGIVVDSVAEANKSFNQFQGKAIVVKPKSTNFGLGVQMLNEDVSLSEFTNAVKQAFTFDKTVMIERFIPGKEFRFLVIDDQVIAILHRIPANVTGDGMLTIEELITKKNDDPLRGKGHVTPFECIVLGKIELECLRMQGKDKSYIPKKGEAVYLRENSNVSTGGDSIDYTDDVIDGYKDIAIKAVKALGAKICGLDMIIADVKTAPNKDNHSIIELNFNPAIYMHNFPYQGTNRHVERKVLDILGY